MRAKRWTVSRLASVDTPTTLKAIETRFDGYRFRSRLEARWAVFFKTLGVRYEYEKEGYDLGAAGWYLPDFWLPDQKCWQEVKGQPATKEEMLKAAILAQATGFPVALFERTDFSKPQFVLATAQFVGMWGRAFWPERTDDSGDFGAHWSVCVECEARGVLYLDEEHKPSCGFRLIKVQKERNDRGWRLPESITQALTAARSARFEHGARG
jgi:hypothetical protein